MAQFNFCGPSYTSQSPTADAERCLNLYPEVIEANGKSQMVMYPTSGLNIYADLRVTNLTPQVIGPVRGMTICPNGTNSAITVAVIGQYFIKVDNFKINPFGTFVPGGVGSVLSNDGNFVPMVSQGIGGGGLGNVLFASAGLAYFFVTTANTVTAIPAATFNNANVIGVDYVDGFFLALTDAGRIYASNSLDPSTWGATAFTVPSTINTYPVAMIVNQRQLWVFGQNGGLVYWDSGNIPFPLDVIQGSTIEQGCGAKRSLAKLDNSVFWLGLDVRGQAIVWRANGYTPQRVSNHAVEYAMQSYPKVSDAFAYAFQSNGHSFYQITFPSANSGNGATWSYDVATNMWHERCFLNGITEQAHPSNNYIFQPAGVLDTFGNLGTLHLVGDSTNPIIYQMEIPTPNNSGGWNFVTDFGNPIKRLRRAPVVNIEQEWMNYWELAIDVETGLGPIPPLTGASTSQPVAYLADSNGVIWAVTINDVGTIVTTSGGAGPSEKIIINDSTSNTISWQLGITIGGVLTATSVSYLKVYPQIFQMATSGSLLQSGIQITNGGAVSTVTPFAASRDPQIMLRFSKDNSHTWSNYFNLAAGQAGNYLKRVVHRRMGRARQMTFEVSSTDPIPYRFVNAYLRATSYGPEERLTKKLAKSA